MICTYPVTINHNVLRNGTGWSNQTQFLEDETRSGKRKRRLSPTKVKKPFTVKMHFTETEYHTFDEWFETTLLNGMYPFYFPRIDKSGNDVLKVYQFTKDGAPSYTNISGKIVEATMKWEEV